MPRRPAASHAASSTGGWPSPAPAPSSAGCWSPSAGVSTFLAWQQASGPADPSYAVAARPIHPGQSLTDADVRFEPLDLPAGLAAAAFTDASGIEGRVALGPIGDGELVQLGQVSDPGQASPGAELSFSIARDRAVDGRLRSGDLVDVFVTDDGGTTAVAEGVQIVDATARDGGSFGSTGELTITLTVADPRCGSRSSRRCARERSRWFAAPTCPAMVADGRPTATSSSGSPGRAAWFGQVARWATAAALPVDFVKTVSGEEVRARLRSGRPFSALLVDGGLAALDRDLIELAGRHGCAVIAVDDGRSAWSWRPRRRGRAARRRRARGAAGRPAAVARPSPATTTFRRVGHRPSGARPLAGPVRRRDRVGRRRSLDAGDGARCRPGGRSPGCGPGGPRRPGAPRPAGAAARCR